MQNKKNLFFFLPSANNFDKSKDAKNVCKVVKEESFDKALQALASEGYTIV